MIDYEKLLMEWGQQLIQIPEFRDGIPVEVVQSGWLGFPGATESELTECEKRIRKTLPPSYRKFLKITNGWRETGNLAGQLFPANKIEWFSKNHQKDFIDPWIKGYYLSGKPTRVPDEEYYQYGEDQNSFSYLIRAEYLTKALAISDIGESAVYLLNPEIMDSDHEWEAWYFEPELGIRRYRSFEDLLQGEYKWFLQSNGIS